MVFAITSPTVISYTISWVLVTRSTGVWCLNCCAIALLSANRFEPLIVQNAAGLEHGHLCYKKRNVLLLREFDRRRFGILSPDKADGFDISDVRSPHRLNVRETRDQYPVVMGTGKDVAHEIGAEAPFHVHTVKHIVACQHFCLQQLDNLSYSHAIFRSLTGRIRPARC